MRIRSKALSFIFLISFFLFIIGCEQPNLTPTSVDPILKNARIDLTTYDFDNNEPLNLDGTWNFYPSQLILPEDGIVENVKSIEVPKRWDQSGYPAMGFGTYQLAIYKNTNIPLALRIPDLFSAYHLYVNGRLLANMGTPGTDAKSSQPGRQYKLVPLGHIQSDTLNVVFQISNFVHSKGGIGHPIVIGTYDELSKRKFQNDAFDFFLAGCLVVGGFFFLGLFFFGQKEKMALFFALFCIAYGYRIIGWGNYALHDLIDMPYRLGIIIEYGTLYLSAYFFTIYIKHLFHHEVPKLFINTLAYFYLLWALLSLLPVYIVSQINMVFLFSLFVGFGLLIYIFIRAIINHRVGTKYFFYSTIGIFIVFLMKTMDYLNIMEEVQVISIVGQLQFFLFQSLILSKHFSASWREAKLQAETATKAKSEFLSVISHEIRTPLNAVMGTTDHLLEENPRTDQVKELNNLKNSSENLLTLVNNVLDFSKIDTGNVEFEEVDVRLKDYCSNALDVFQSVANKKGLELQFEYDEELPKIVKLDKTRVNQVLANLLGNGVKFTEEGCVRLKVKQDYREKNVVGVKFEIEDTGIGVNKQQQEFIFDSFQQASTSISEKYGGTGLGLSITKRLVEMMGSDIFLKSKTGLGSLFYFTLPLNVGDEKNLKDQKMELYDLVGFKVLLVEDNTVNVLIARRLLEKWKMKVEVAENGIIAVRKAEECDFDVVLMDLRMPEMDGYEATKILREKGFSKPILAVTASPKLDESSKLRDSGFDGIVVKPYNKEDLFAAISEKLPDLGK